MVRCYFSASPKVSIRQWRFAVGCRHPPHAFHFCRTRWVDDLCHNRRKIESSADIYCHVCINSTGDRICPAFNFAHICKTSTGSIRLRGYGRVWMRDQHLHTDPDDAILSAEARQW